jgi:hypothetical protein
MVSRAAELENRNRAPLRLAPSGSKSKGHPSSWSGAPTETKTNLQFCSRWLRVDDFALLR